MRGQLIGSEYTSKLSPWLANGSLSVRRVYHALKDFRGDGRSNSSAEAFIDALFQRDFHRFWAMKNQDKIFAEYGIYDRRYKAWRTDRLALERWRTGQTGIPIVDAFMRELNATGFMPGRGRLVVAGYLSVDLR